MAYPKDCPVFRIWGRDYVGQPCLWQNNILAGHIGLGHGSFDEFWTIHYSRLTPLTVAAKELLHHAKEANKGEDHDHDL